MSTITNNDTFANPLPIVPATAAESDRSRESETSLESRDRELFDTIAEKYAAKDRSPSVRPARRLRLLQTMRALPQSSLQGKRILEVGCGAGYSVDYLPADYACYLGIDYSEMLIDLARSERQTDRATFATTNARDLKTDEPFDIIFMIGVLHHMDQMDEVVQNLVSLLAPGGWLVVNEPQPSNPIVGLARRLRKQCDASYSDEQLELTGQEMESCFASAGLTSLRLRSQGLMSTPFAEVPMKPSWLTAPASRIACGLDRGIEAVAGRLLTPLTWNVIVAGQKPCDAQSTLPNSQTPSA
ncbi:Phthiotriol/phenolphthiotriol dimycocerosates methyltransferase [Rosistilla ulvae]|uniref:Phthiotriol/phenolphthiotriol dimycocerosates methyltransferase n=1 Tax=Rosistilla ulvae TaxID=1930277 RepID=A0A517LVM2_9BACT|nr:class I SAM-dependent methyltransferase [Rosistilla ulvae]QDS86670.1 Phthiotriol/phenolphthiotriol dimycocerosates methyltransferase [Rosistilla ulvae]